MDEITILSKNENKLTTISRNATIFVENNMLKYKVGFGDMVIDIFDSEEEAQRGLMKIYNAINNEQRCCALSTNNNKSPDIDIEQEIERMKNGDKLMGIDF